MNEDKMNGDTMISEDKIPIPFLDTIATSQEITVKLGEPINGCHNQCPCRRWINCSYYNKIQWKYSGSEHVDEILKWYDTHFRIKFETPDISPNG